jgi:hypothetical protein
MRVGQHVFDERSHKQFHPDRCSLQGLLTTMKDDEARGMMEVAANTVVRASTPLWPTHEDNMRDTI